MAGKPLEAMTLLGLGYRTLSMSMECIGPVKQMVRSADIRKIEAFVTRICTSREYSAREQLRAFAKDHSVII
jgi:phosphotransferase system enzyme I (PtsP)